jgi:hypothetical protein
MFCDMEKEHGGTVNPYYRFASDGDSRSGIGYVAVKFYVESN